MEYEREVTGAQKKALEEGIENALGWRTIVYNGETVWAVEALKKERGDSNEKQYAVYVYSPGQGIAEIPYDRKNNYINYSFKNGQPVIQQFSRLTGKFAGEGVGVQDLLKGAMRVVETLDKDGTLRALRTKIVSIPIGEVWRVGLEGGSVKIIQTDRATGEQSSSVGVKHLLEHASKRIAAKRKPIERHEAEGASDL